MLMDRYDKQSLVLLTLAGKKIGAKGLRGVEMSPKKTVGPKAIMCSTHHEEHSIAHGVTDKKNLLITCGQQHVVYSCWQVIVSHLMPTVTKSSS